MGRDGDMKLKDNGILDINRATKAGRAVGKAKGAVSSPST